MEGDSDSYQQDFQYQSLMLMTDQYELTNSNISQNANLLDIETYAQ